MGILSDLADIKNVSDTIVANKVSKFAYTDYAYEHNEANGVTTYDVNQEQNIPVGTPSVMKVNETVVTKGWRARASSITRMLMNHFLGRLSYNVNKLTDMFSSLITAFSSSVGTANGLATLDANGRIPFSQLPESAVELKGYWNADTNTPTLVDGTGTDGDEYIVDTAGTQDLGSGEQYFKVGDRVLYLDGIWKNLDTGLVKSVNTLTPDNQGNITVNMDNGNIWTSKWIKRVFGRRLNLNWKYSDFSSNGDQISEKNLVYAEGIYTVLGYHSTGGGSAGNVGVVYWSEDGKNWNRNQLTNTGNYFNGDLLYANGLWLASYKIDTNNNLHTLVYSTDGKNFALIPDSSVVTTNTSLTLTYGNGLWVLGKQGSNASSQGIYWSEDGLHWTAGSITSSVIQDLIFGEDVFVAVERVNNTTSYVSYSEDGDTWTRTSLTNANIITIAYTKDKFFALVYSVGLYYSTDGINWLSCLVSSLPTWIENKSCSYANGKYFIGSENLLLYSSDGINWGSCTLSSSSSYLRPVGKVLYANGSWLITVDGGGVMYSRNGITWTPIEGSSYQSGNSTYYYNYAGLCYANGLWFTTRSNYESSAPAKNLAILSSEDGATWAYYKHISNSSSASVGYVYNFNDKFVYVSRGAKFGYTGIDLLLEEGYFTD